jgi:predicted metalloprotease
MDIQLNIKKSVLLSALKVLKEVLPVSRKAQQNITMTMVITNRQLTLSCTIASVSVPCNCKGDGKIIVPLTYFKRIVEDEQGQFFSGTFKDNSLYLNNHSISGFQVLDIE